MSKRNINIRKRVIAKMWTCEVTDSYGITHVNYFETELKASKWVYYIWENEDEFYNQDSDELLTNAIEECIKLDKEAGITSENRDCLD